MEDRKHAGDGSRPPAGETPKNGSPIGGKVLLNLNRQPYVHRSINAFRFLGFCFGLW
jgi:hypothetical protein